MCLEANKDTTHNQLNVEKVEIYNVFGEAHDICFRWSIYSRNRLMDSKEKKVLSESTICHSQIRIGGTIWFPEIYNEF